MISPSIEDDRGDINTAVEKQSGKPQGLYWQYAGAGLWNSMTIKPKGKQYQVDFDGYYAGMMAMFYGPNLGEFSTVLAFNNGKAHYAMTGDDGDCEYDFEIKQDGLTANRTAGDSCGFGHNVSAEGNYQRVEL